MNTPDTNPVNGPGDTPVNGSVEESANDGGTVLPFRANTAHRPEDIPVQHTPGAALVRDAAIEGEVLTDEQSKALDRKLARQAVRAVVVPVRVVRRVGQDERTKTAGKAVIRHGLTVCQGLGSWGTRAWDASTMGVYRRQIKAAEAVGNQELLAEWVERKERASETRHKRLVELPKLAFGVAKVAVGSLAALVVLTLLVGLFVQLSGTGEFTAVITGVMDAIRWVFTAIAFAWTPLMMAAPWLILLAAWREGRRRGAAPSWLATAADADTDAAIDETTIATALKALRIPQVNDYLKQGLPLQYLTPCRIDGRGTHAVIRLPAGVTAEKIARRRADLARFAPAGQGGVAHHRDRGRNPGPVGGRQGRPGRGCRAVSAAG